MFLIYFLNSIKIYFFSCHEKSGVGKCWHWFSISVISQQSLQVGNHFLNTHSQAPLRAFKIRFPGMGLCAFRQTSRPWLMSPSGEETLTLKDACHTLKCYACFKFSGLMWQPKNLGSMGLLSRIQKFSPTKSCVSYRDTFDMILKRHVL